MTRFTHRHIRAAIGSRIRRNRVAEMLEPRVLLSTYMVTNTADSGPGSLRQAILDANSHAGADTIAFNIPGVGVQTIAPTSPLPVITDAATIDGTTQPGYSAAAGAPVIELSGAQAGAGANGLVLGSTTGGAEGSPTVVKALIVNRFAEDGIVLNGSGQQVKGCYIGLNAAGDAAAPNGGNGITIVGTQVLIGGSSTAERNVISGNRMAGIDDLAGSAIITGNYIGTDAIGSAAVGNGHEGLRVLAGATIGGAGPLRNVISGNGYSGIIATAQAPNQVQIAGNFIGTDATGLAAIGNGASPAAPYRDGITVSGNAQIGMAPNGTAPALGNVISGNKGEGISISSLPDTRSQITANLIGTDVTGNVELGNSGDGIRLAGTVGTAVTIGSTTILEAPGVSILTGGGNLISGNGRNGILVQGTGGAIQDNYIGTNLAGSTALPNSANGIELQGAGTFVGQELGPGNVISGNAANGILIDNAAGRSTGVGANRITDNLIGTDASGNVALGNAANGILIVGSNSNSILAGRRQVISGNGGAGISLVGPFTTSLPGGNNQVSNNYIGTNIAANAPLPNGGNGVEVFEANDTVQQNVISANKGSGVYLGTNPMALPTDAAGDRVVHNEIGTNLLGNVVNGLGNAGDGVTIFRSSNNTIGTMNIIAGNGGNGVTVDAGGIISPGGVQNTAAVRNRITQNSIFANGRLGIDLGNDGVTPVAPPAIPRTGPNLLENIPMIVSATATSTFTLVRYDLAEQTATNVEFFTNDAADPSGYGEGQKFVGLFNVADGVTQATAQLPALPVGTIITATATDTAGNTSEFSQAVAVIAPPPTVTNFVFNPQNNSIAVTFSKDVSATVSPSAMRVHNQTTGGDVAVTGVSYDPTTNTATFQLPGNLPGGLYVITLLARVITDSSGEHLDGNRDGTPGDDYTFQFTYTAGDVNLDGAVSFPDLLILASNYGKAGTFEQGDLNHDGRIDFADLLILAQAYGRNGGALAAVARRLR